LFLSVPNFIALLAGVYALSSNDIRVGTNIEVDGAPWKVLGD
jgi:elongation factor P